MTQTYAITLTGESPLLMHADDLKWRAQLDKWQADPENQKHSKKGDDRTPAWRWVGYTYHDGTYVGIPADNLMTALREGGAKVPTGKKGGTYKRQSQSGLVVNELIWPVRVTQGLVPWAHIAPLVGESDYERHEAAAVALGFELFAKSVRVGMQKHTRVRPRFNTWAVQGSITVFDETITPKILQSILDVAGTKSGLGDWRPSSPSKPGPWGRFKAECEAQ